ncbi:MAG: ribonucleoside-diphosphate reductase subunit alpha [Candidatus Riesia sp.]|nr:ribonucleoside-diphosphate reductase subunit alpha [Candidatus Riesia sp.]
MEISIVTERVQLKDIKVGDYIKSYDHDLNMNDYKEVKEVFFPEVPHEKQARITFDDEEYIITSNTHRMWVKQNEQWDYCETKDIIIGDLLLQDDGKEKIVSSVVIGKQTEETSYRDLTIEGNHNYFVAIDSNSKMVLGHNSANCFIPFWHLQIKDFMVLKNNKGTDETRARKMDYCMKVSKIFYERYLNNEKITLFSPHEVPELVQSFGTPSFDKLYKEAEKRRGIRKVKIDAVTFFHEYLLERVATGRMYIMNVDHVNSHSSFVPTIHMSNLCMEITLLTKPIKDFNDPKGEIALCILSAINVVKCRTDAELEETCRLAVYGLDSVIDQQDYVLPAAEIPAKKRRPLGVGITNLAAYLAERKLKYSDNAAIKVVHDLQEKIQFYLLKASCELAKEKGPCEWFNETKYSQGLLPIDTYRRTVDEICPNVLNCDWEWLREQIRIYGLRNSTLSAQMPCESSSIASNSTNGHDPVRKLITEKRSKVVTLTQLVPNFEKYGKYYETQFDMPDNYGYINICAVMQKFIDQSISANTYHDYTKYPDEQIPMSDLVAELIYGYKMGIKTWYYNVTPDERDESAACAGGGCAV